MKTFKAVFLRENPQIGEYYVDRIIEARTIAAARKRCRQIEDLCIYGSMLLAELKEV